MSTRLEWYPAASAMVAFETGARVPYRLISLDGIGPVSVSPVTIKSPNQAGETAVDAIVPPRVVTLQAFVQGESRDAAWAIRAALSRALAVQPVRLGEQQQLGRLRLVRDGADSLELQAIPRSSHVPQPRGSVGIIPVDVEWLCPLPWWREIADTVAALESEGGFEWSLEFGLEIPSNNIELEIDNGGDVDTPTLARLYGDVTTARLLNVTTSETIEITGAIDAGDYIEISTAFGDKRVELVEADGTRSNAMDRLNLSLADFWTLRPGVNLVRFEADINVSGRAVLSWREMFSGI